MKPSNRIFSFFLSLPFLACHSVTHFKVPTVSVLHPSALFPAHLWGVRHSKSAHQAPSITMPGKSGTAKQNSFEVPPQALLSVAFIHHFPSVPHSTGRLQKSLCLVSGVSFLTYRSVTPVSSLLVNRGEPHIDHPQNQNPSVPAN